MRKIVVALFIGALFFVSRLSFAEEEKDSKGILVLREAQRSSDTTVAVTAYLMDDILEIKVITKMLSTRPKIIDVLLEGPKSETITPQTMEKLFPAVEEEEPFPRAGRDDSISFGKKIDPTQANGRIAREMVKFRISPDKLISGQSYKLSIRTRGLRKKGKVHLFKFDLKNIGTLISQ